MSNDISSRTEAILGTESVKKLNNATVLIAGLGGVGGFCLEALVRSGVNSFVLIDSDVFEASNINRQMLCLSNSIGSHKTDMAEKRALAINPDVKITKHSVFLDENNTDGFLENIDLVIDAIDSVPSKCYLLKRCIERKIPVVSSMGAALRKDPTLVRTADISKTFSDPLAKTVRTILRKEGIESGIICVFSTEKPAQFNGSYLGSLITVTGTFGLTLAQVAIDILTQ